MLTTWMVSLGSRGRLATARCGSALQFAFVLPGVLRWFSANIGLHHVHHLQSLVPFYRLPEILRDHPQLAEAQRLTLRESLGCIGKQLWDEKSWRLVSFRTARMA